MYDHEKHIRAIPVKSPFLFILVLAYLVFPIQSLAEQASQSAVLPSAPTLQKPTCKCFPGDLCWPSASAWEAFNVSVDGRLIATVPLASPCHTSGFASYNADRCKALQDQWLMPQIQYGPHLSSISFVSQREGTAVPPKEWVLTKLFM